VRGAESVLGALEDEAEVVGGEGGSAEQVDVLGGAVGQPVCTDCACAGEGESELADRGEEHGGDMLLLLRCGIGHEVASRRLCRELGEGFLPQLLAPRRQHQFGPECAQEGRVE
jgi:hypothetical protein